MPEVDLEYIKLIELFLQSAIDNFTANIGSSERLKVLFNSMNSLLRDIDSIRADFVGWIFCGCKFMINTISKVLLFLIFSGFYSYAVSGDESSEDESASEANVLNEEILLTGDKEAGEARYNKTCINCHGPAGKGAASFPKVSGNEISYTKEKLEAYREGIKVGPNSSLMIMMAKPLSDEEITDLAAYLEDATYK